MDDGQDRGDQWLAANGEAECPLGHLDSKAYSLS